LKNHFVALALLILLSSCANKNKITTINEDLITFSFGNSSFYEDKDVIIQILSDKKNEFYFRNLIRIFNSNPDNFNDNKEVALIYAGLLHNGYRHESLNELEDSALTQYESGNLELAENLASQAQKIFPLSLKSIWVKYLVSTKIGDSKTENLCFKQLQVLFGGMQGSGNEYVKNRPQVAHSKNAIELFYSVHAAEVAFVFEKTVVDKDGNEIEIYNSNISKDTFVLPLKSWASTK
jgi:hypothetical protein